MNVVLIGSPDKVALSNFVKFLKKSLGEYSLGGLHSLMSPDSVQQYMDNFLEQYPKAIFTYYAKRKINVADPLAVFPTYAHEKADVVIWFDLYSIEPRLVKDRFDVMKLAIDNWKKSVGIES